MPTKLIKQGTMSIYMAPDSASWNSWAENMVDPIIHMGSCSSANSGGMPEMSLGRLSPCRDHVISANPGGGVCCQLMVLSSCGYTSWVGAASCLAIWVVAVDLDFPMPWAAENYPLEQALQFLLWLLLPLRTGYPILDDTILTQLEGVVSPRTSTSVSVVRGSIAHLGFCTFCQLGRLTWGQWLGFFCPMLEGLCVSQGLLRLNQPIVLAAKSHVLEWQESIPVQGVGCWWHRVVVLYFGDIASHFWDLKGNPHLPGEFLDVILAGIFSEFLPPGWHVQLLFTPADPLSSSLGGRLRH